MDAVVKLELVQGVFEPFTDDLGKTFVDHGV